jgi:hypothetical protein
MTIGPVTAIRLDPPALDVGGDAFRRRASSAG